MQLCSNTYDVVSVTREINGMIVVCDMCYHIVANNVRSVYHTCLNSHAIQTWSLRFLVEAADPDKPMNIWAPTFVEKVETPICKHQ